MVTDIAILIVDDKAHKRLALTVILEPLGHTLFEAESGLEALRRVLERDYSVILMDVRMPRMDGFETVSCIRQRRQSRSTPIIFVTAYQPDDLQLVSNEYVNSADEFLFAPLNPDVVRARVAATIGSP